MRIPDSPSDPRPRRPIPGRPKKPSTPGLPQSSGKPATRAEFARLRAILDQDSATDLGDLIIRWGEGQPSEDALAALGDTSRELVEWATAHSEEVARRVATDRAFADLLASDPVAALKQIGTVPPVTPTTGPTTPQPPPRTRPDRDVPPAAAEVFGALGGRRFDIPVELLGRQAVAEDLTVTQSAALGLLGETMQAALATPKGWPDLRSDPPAAVLAASKRFAWTAVGVSPDSARGCLRGPAGQCVTGRRTAVDGLVDSGDRRILERLDRGDRSRADRLAGQPDRRGDQRRAHPHGPHPATGEGGLT